MPLNLRNKGRLVYIFANVPYITFVFRIQESVIPEEKRQMIFEAFQQENGTTSRNMEEQPGLSISRELGSTFRTVK